MSQDGLHELIRIFGTDANALFCIESSPDNDGNYVLQISPPQIRNADGCFQSPSIDPLFRDHMAQRLNSLILGTQQHDSSVMRWELVPDEQNNGRIKMICRMAATNIEPPEVVARLKQLNPESPTQLLRETLNMVIGSLSGDSYPRAKQLNQTGWRPPSSPSKALSFLNDIDARIAWEAVHNDGNPSLKIYRTQRPFQGSSEVAKVLESTLDLAGENAIRVDEEGRICIVGARMDSQIEKYAIQQRLGDFCFTIPKMDQDSARQVG